MLFVASCFIVSTAYSQTQKTVECETFTVTELDCVGPVVGEIEYCFVDFGNGKIQQKWKGELEGADDTYCISQVFNCNFTKFSWGLSNNGTQTMTMSIVSQSTGMVVGEYHHTIHGTYNANGELTVFFERGWFECY